MNLPVWCNQEVYTSQAQTDQLGIYVTIWLCLKRDESIYCQWQVHEEQKGQELAPDEIDSWDVPHEADYLGQIGIFEHF